jgi:HD-GYP domain-containing protein (c-di-GMP phosphodiesterase class II)
MASTEVFGLVSKQIKRAIVNQKDCYSFWDNTFYILSYLDNNEVVDNFINYLALTIEKRYDRAFFIKAGYVQYPYDSIDIQNIFVDLQEKITSIAPQKSNYEEGLIMDRDYNMVVGKELARYLTLIKQYGDVLFNHSLFVAKVSVGIAKALNLSKPVIKKLVVAAILHDVGYLCIPQKILIDPAHNNNADTAALIKMHPILATRKILAQKAMFGEVFGFIEQHHEYKDGTGYPFGLSEEELSLESQIISIADTYDLIRQQEGVSNLEIANFFISGAGIRWDEKITNVFAAILVDEKQFNNLTSTAEGSFTDLLTWV